MAASAIDAAGSGTSGQEAEYLELAADFLKLAQNIEDQHAGCVALPAYPMAANHPERLAA